MESRLQMITETNEHGYVGYCIENKKWSSQKVKKDSKGEHIVVKGVKYYIPELSELEYEVIDGLKYYKIEGDIK